MTGTSIVQRAIKIAFLLWLAGWAIKIKFYLPFLATVCLRHPMQFDFFPVWAANPWVSLAAYLLPLAACAAAIANRSVRVWTIAASIMLAGSVTLCLHQNTFNDATFVTSTWSSGWILWLITRRNDPLERLAAWAPALAQGVVSLMFLGGAVGKLTPEYWSGEAFYQIYFLQKDVMFYPWLREVLATETLREVATVFSRLVIVGEFAIAGLILLSSRFTLYASALTMLLVVLISTWYLFSVMGCLIGISMAGATIARGRLGSQFVVVGDR